jgi:hypothetical protein
MLDTVPHAGAAAERPATGLGAAAVAPMGYAPPMTFAPADMRALTRTIEVEIETRPAPGATPHRTIIWVVVDRGQVFIRSVNGARARWYREAIGTPGVAIHVAGRRIPVRVIPATDPDSIARTSASLERKYARDSGTESMLRPEIFGTTLRLEPA